MDKQLAITAIKFLDRIEIKGHQERDALNQVCNALLAIANAPEEVPPSDDKTPAKEKDGKANAK